MIMKTVYYCKGLPASGKSTWAKEKVLKDQGKTVRINKDELREMMFSSKWSKAREKQVLDVRDRIIESAIQEDRNVIVDDTGFADKHWNRIEKIVSKYPGIDMELVDFRNVPVVECIKRNAQRENPVPEEVIWQMYYKFIYKEIETKNTLRKAYIVDVDGTIALHTHRGPYELEKVQTDSVNEPVAQIVRTLSVDNHIIIVTGRENLPIGDTDVRKMTIQWLNDNHIPFDEVFIREWKDNRKDYIVKKEIYEKYIKDNYNVLGAFDDRKQVIDQWRSMGLTVFDVAGHTF